MPAHGNSEEFIRKLLKRKDKAEAMTWLRGHNSAPYRNIGEMTNENSIEFVRQLYDFGAIEIVVVDIARNPPFESTDSLVVTLPDRPALRGAILEFSNRRALEMGLEEVQDLGQQYLFVWFD